MPNNLKSPRCCVYPILKFKNFRFVHFNMFRTSKNSCRINEFFFEAKNDNEH